MTKDVIARQYTGTVVISFVRLPAEDASVVVENVIVVCRDNVIFEETTF